MSRTIVTVGIPAQAVRAIGMVGSIVTYSNQQYKIHSVEGHDYYAFLSFVGDGSVTADFNMSPAYWCTEPIANLLPMGREIGEGYSVAIPLARVRRGVCLAKRAS